MSDSNEITRLRVAVLYGGRSTEHEVSQQSAAAVVANLDPLKYEVIPISIDKQGNFHRHDLAALRAHNPRVLASESSAAALTVAARPGPLFLSQGAPAIDVVFPIMHGPLCEDGSIQGLLELAAVPYVGARVLGSAIGMDKDVAKRLVRAEGIGVAPYLVVHRPHWEREPERAGAIEQIERELGYPVFVKPATLGSSVGVSRAADRAQLEAAVLEAQRFDDKTLIEQSVDAREIEFAVLAAEDTAAPPDVSLPGEIVPRDAFYSFDRKYLDAEGAQLHAPAELSEEQTREGQALARQIFLALECEGMARVDMFLDRRRGRFLFNEVNTIPGFTAISMYPKLWEISGLSYSALLDRLVKDALRRHARRSELQRER